MERLEKELPASYNLQHLVHIESPRSIIYTILHILTQDAYGTLIPVRCGT